MRSFQLTALVGLALLSVTGAAHATLIVSSTTNLPADNYTPPTSILYGSNVVLGASGSSGGASPFADTTSKYVGIQSGTAEYYFGAPENTLSLVWGSPDAYNFVSLYNGGIQVGALNGSSIGQASQNYFTTLTSTSAFDRVDFSSDNIAFEISNVSASNVSAVPLPASLPMFGAALLALCGFAWLKKRGGGHLSANAELAI